MNPISAAATAHYAKAAIPELPVADFRVLGGLLYVGGGTGRSMWSGQAVTLMLRIGVASQIDSKTVIRTGYGTFYDTIGTDRSPAIQRST